jgi:hypothetical protein
MVPADSVHAYGPGSWRDRYGPIPEVAGSAAAHADRGNFFDLMARNHVLIMGDEPHVCTSPVRRLCACCRVNQCRV